jgi:hypothetical protein
VLVASLARARPIWPHDRQIAPTYLTSRIFFRPLRVMANNALHDLQRTFSKPCAKTDAIGSALAVVVRPTTAPSVVFVRTEQMLMSQPDKSESAFFNSASSSRCPN